MGGGDGYAKDVVCGLQVRRSDAPARATHAGTTYFFCSDKCEHRFAGGPDRCATGDAATGMDEVPAGSVTDPVCGMTVDPATAAQADYAGRDYAFCSTGCHDRFVAEPLAHLETARDPVCGMDVRTRARGRGSGGPTTSSTCRAASTPSPPACRSSTCAAAA